MITVGGTELKVTCTGIMKEPAIRVKSFEYQEIVLASKFTQFGVVAPSTIVA